MDYFLIKGNSFSRLYSEYKKYGSLVIGYDFDDTVHDFHQRGSTFVKVIKLIRDLKKLGFTTVCWTAHPDPGYVADYLRDNRIPCDGINVDGIRLGWTSRKPMFSALLDDRAGLIQVYNDLKLLVKTIKKEKRNANIASTQ